MESNDRFLDLMRRARELDVIDSGSTLIFDDYLKQCQIDIKKNEIAMENCRGKIMQLKLSQSMIENIIHKYISLQENHNRNADEALKRRGGNEEPSLEEPQPDSNSEVSEPPEEEKKAKRGRPGKKKAKIQEKVE